MKGKNVVFMLALLVVCAVVYFLVDRQSAPAGRLPAVWPSVKKEEVSAITMKGQGSSLELRRREGGTDRWDSIVNAELVRADANAIDDFLTAISRQSVRDRLDAAKVTDSSRAAYGLDKPLVEVGLVAAGQPVVARFGKLSSEGSKVYADGGPGTDVWVVTKDAMELAISAISSGLREKRLFDSTLFDVAKLEVLKGGVTVAELSRDLSQIWRISQPFKGYAHPTKFETELNRIVNGEVERWEEFGAPDLVKYGLAQPEYEVRVTPKIAGRRTEVLLVGKHDADGVFVMEAGTKTVTRAGKRFFEAVSRDPLEYRDRSFTRLGIDGSTVDVQVRDAHYKLESAGQTWDVVIGTERHPADRGRVDAVLDRLRSWQTYEFHDAEAPADRGIGEKDFIEVALTAKGRDAPGKVTLLIGTDGPAGPGGAPTVFAQRKDDGAVELVEKGPLDDLLRGPQQFFRSSPGDLPADSVDRIAREKGTGPEGDKVQAATVSRDLNGANKAWRFEGGSTGEPEAKPLNDMLAALQGLKAVEWIPFAAEKDGERMGIKPPRAETCALVVHLANVAGIDPEPTIYVGKRRAEGGYYARFVGKDNVGNWAFVLPDDVVDALKAPFSKD